MEVIFGVIDHTGTTAGSQISDSLVSVGKCWRDGAILLGTAGDCANSGCDVEHGASAGPRHTIVAHGRLDNRTELFGRLDIPVQSRLSLSDSQLILAAYAVRGAACVEQLLGDFCFAIWDAAEHTLFLARDQAGTSSLFFYRGSGFFLFSSDIELLLNLKEVPRVPDHDSVISIISRVGPEDYTRTSYQGIRQLPPAHRMMLREGRGEPEQYWIPANRGNIRFSSDDDYVEAFLEVYSTAVACRVPDDGVIGVTLSGGLDSGSVASLASRELGSRGSRLSAYCSALQYHDGLVDSEASFADEVPYARATAEFSGIARFQPVQAANISPLMGIREALHSIHQPFLPAASSYWLVALFRRMHEDGCSVALVGQGGNATLSWNGNRTKYLRNLILNFSGKRFLRELSIARKRDRLSVYRIFRQMLVKPLLPAQLIRYSRYTRAAKGSEYAFSALNPDCVSPAELNRQRLRTDGFVMGFSDRGFREKLLGAGCYSPSATMATLAARQSIELRDPTVDVRLIEFCFAIPESQYVQGGRQRWLARRALEGILPAEVLTETRRGQQSADILARIRHSRTEMAAALSDAGNSDLARKYLNLKRMTEVFDAALSRDDIRTEFESNIVLLEGLKMALFLQSFEEGT